MKYTKDMTEEQISMEMRDIHEGLHFLTTTQGMKELAAKWINELEDKLCVIRSGTTH